MREPQRFMFRWAAAKDTVLSDAALSALIGQEAPLRFMGVDVGVVRVTAAHNYVDEVMGPGVWVECEQLASRPLYEALAVRVDPDAFSIEDQPWMDPQ